MLDKPLIRYSADKLLLRLSRVVFGRRPSTANQGHDTVGHGPPQERSAVYRSEPFPAVSLGVAQNQAPCARLHW